MRRLAALVCAGALLVLAAGAPPSLALEYDKFAIASTSAKLSTNQAGAHPDFTTTLEIAMNPSAPTDPTGLKLPYASTQDVVVSLPPGLLGNLNAVDSCSSVQFVTGLTGQGCSPGSQVGVAAIFASLGVKYTASIYNLETVGDDEVARFGFFVSTIPSILKVRVRSESGSDYGITAEAAGISAVAPLQKITTTLWGVPADASHENQRLTIQETIDGRLESPLRSSGRSPEPFLTNPTVCGRPLEVGFAVDSYQEPGRWHRSTASLGAITGCPRLSFEPSFSLTPTSREAAAPSGAEATLTVPQNEAANGYATSHLRDAVVGLPEGLTVAAGTADGLQACSAGEMGYGVSPPPPARCPEAARLATAEIDSPSLSRSIQGALYLRTPEPGRLARVWLAADDLGVHVKLPGEFRLDPETGQITSLFLETPQVPVRQLELHFKGGPRGVIATPAACGAYQTSYRLTPWSGGADAEGKAPMTIDRGCDTGGFEPELSAGTVNPSAGRFSPFVGDLTRDSGEQNLAGLSLDLPRGVLAKLAGVAVCADAPALTGACPETSRIGAVAVASGPGTSPLWIPQPGKQPTAAYLAGPYRGAPYSLVVKAPAQAGPFDLGTVVVRSAIQVDPDTTRVTVSSDPLPQFLEGIPVSYREVHVDVDRPSFILNPTSCDPMAVTGAATSARGARAALSSRFQVGGCARLGFKPKLSLSLGGGTGRGAHPSLRAVLKMSGGGANIARAQIGLPRSEFLESAHIRTVCTRVQFAAERCPGGSIYGLARAFTPLLDRPLEGPVYLRSSNHELPDLVADLRGQIHVVVDGRIDSVDGGIRATFAAVPDAPVSRFVLSMQGGRKGLLVNSQNLCAGINRATVKMDAQNGKVADAGPVVVSSCRRRRG